jgi:hypothetical protein
VGRGLDAIVDHLARWTDMWEDWSVEVDRFIDRETIASSS